MDSGITASAMDAVDKLKPTAPSMKDTGKMTYLKEKEEKSAQMERFMKVNGTADGWKVKEYFFALMELHSQASGLLANSMDTVIKNGQMALNMKETSLRALRKDMAFSLLAMVAPTRESFTATEWRDTGI